MRKIKSIIDKVVYLYIQTTITNKSSMIIIELIKIDDGNEISRNFIIDSREKQINYISEIDKIIGDYYIITDQVDIIKNNHILKGIFKEKSLLDIRELIFILEPSINSIKITDLVKRLTTIEIGKVEDKCILLKIICNTFLCRQWQREESLNEKEILYNKINSLFGREECWKWNKYLLRPLMFSYDIHPYVIYDEGRDVCKSNKKDIDYKKYEELLRDTELWNDEGKGAYQYRKDQERISRKIKENIENEKRIFIEAPTGSGKTFAYVLIVAIKSYLEKKGKKRGNNSFIISTDTKELQNQLIEKDIPMIIKKLNLEGKVSFGAMKGKGNYICVERLNKYKEFLESYTSKLTYLYLYRLSKGGNFGDLENINYWAFDYFNIGKYINNINCDSETCNLDKCRKECYLRNRYNELQSEDITVVNHSLLASWPYGEKKKIQNLILDEAHNLMDKAYDFFSEEFNSYDFLEQLKKIDNENPSILFLLDRLNGIYNYKVHIDKPNIIKLRNDIQFIIYTILSEVNTNSDVQKEYNLNDEFFNAESENKKIMDYLSHKFKELNFSIYRLYKALYDYVEEIVSDDKENGNEFKSISNFICRLKESYDTIDNFITFSKEYAKIIDIDKGYKFFSIKNTPLKIGEIINQTIFKETKSITFLSATLKINNSFYDVKRILGQENADDFTIRPVFNLKEKTRIFTVRGIGSYKDGERFNKNTAKFIYDIAVLTEGHMLVLFNNNNRRDSVKKNLDLIVKDTDFEVYTSKKAIHLLNDINKKVIILGTKGFFEGIDIPGDALSCVIVDKIPNINPKDPLFKAFKEYKNSYYKSYNYPKVCIKMKQSYGRLVRSVLDYGYFIILDGGTNEGTLKQLEEDLMGSEIENKWSSEILNYITYDFNRWKEENLKVLLLSMKENSLLDNFNEKSKKMKLFWRIDKEVEFNDRVSFKNKGLTIKLKKRL